MTSIQDNRSGTAVNLSHVEFIEEIKNLSLKDGIWNGYLIVKNDNLLRINVFQYIGERLFGEVPSRKLLEAATIKYLENHTRDVEKLEEIAYVSQLAENVGLTQNNATKDNIKEIINSIYWHIIEKPYNQNSSLEEKTVKIEDIKNENLQEQPPYEEKITKNNINELNEDGLKSKIPNKTSETLEELDHIEIVQEGQEALEDQVSVQQQQEVQEEVLDKQTSEEEPFYREDAPQDSIEIIENNVKETHGANLEEIDDNPSLWDLKTKSLDDESLSSNEELRNQKFEKLQKLTRKIDDLQKRIDLRSSYVQFVEKIAGVATILPMRSVIFYDAIVAPPPHTRYMNSLAPGMPTAIHQANLVISIATFATLIFTTVYYDWPLKKDIEKINKLNEKHWKLSWELYNEQ